MIPVLIELPPEERNTNALAHLFPLSPDEENNRSRLKLASIGRIHPLVYTIDACPCCGSKNLTLFPAVVAPFLASYAVGSRPARCSLAQCLGCSLRFFTSRLTPDEVTKLYSGYRGEEYFQQRHNAEPWYSRSVNNGIAGDPNEIQTRNTALEAFLQPHINGQEVNAVLDYGGDRGQFIPRAVGKEKFVFELSAAQPVDGVTRIASEAELDGRRFDLTLLLGVLEHCPEPLSVLQKVRPLMRGPDARIIIGVPYEWYGLKSVRPGRVYSWYLDTLLKSRPLMKAIDFYSTLARVRFHRIPPFGIVKCHEHLNFFNEQSMTALLRGAGMDLVACSTTQTCSYPAPTLSLNVLAKPADNRLVCAT